MGFSRVFLPEKIHGLNVHHVLPIRKTRKTYEKIDLKNVEKLLLFSSPLNLDIYLTETSGRISRVLLSLSRENLWMLLQCSHFCDIIPTPQKAHGFREISKWPLVILDVGSLRILDSPLCEN